MKTRVADFGSLLVSMSLLISVTACNKEDYYQKEFLNNPYQETDGPVDDGDQGGSNGGTQGGVAGGVTGGSTGGATGGSTGGTTGGSTGGSTGGGAAQAMEENFSQTAAQTKKLDIVWVIDNSGSMADEQQNLADNFNVFIHDFIQKNVDFKMAITTTDARSAYKGLMVPNSDVKLTSVAAHNDEPQFISDFKSMIKVGINGSGAEKGLSGAEGFMVRYADSFLRSDAYLAIVVVSDEEDQSPYTVKDYTDYYKSMKSAAGLVKVYSIVDSNLQNVASNVTQGFQRYADASAQTAGAVMDIYDDFAASLTAMGDSIINLLESFALAHDPVAGSLEVRVNNVLSTDYTFDAQSRSIKFNAGHVPAAGSSIKVNYIAQ